MLAKSELETAVLKVQTIVVDAVLRARVELMGEFKRGEQTSQDPDEQIWTWKIREALVAAGGDGEESEEKEEEESTPIAGSLKHAKLGDSSKQARAKAGAGDVLGDMGEQGPAEPVASHEDITRD